MNRMVKSLCLQIYPQKICVHAAERSVEWYNFSSVTFTAAYVSVFMRQADKIISPLSFPKKH